MIKEVEKKVNHNLTLNNIEGKIDIKPIKEEMNKLIALYHERNKISFVTSPPLIPMMERMRLSCLYCHNRQSRPMNINIKFIELKTYTGA